MTTTTIQNLKEIAKALASAQAEMGKALKQANNPAFRSKYADLGNVMDACLPALNKFGIAVIQPLDENEFGRYVKTVFIHTSGETLETRVPLIVGKNDMQGLGSAITYARRYGLMTLAGIAPEDDDGNAAAASIKQEPAKPAQKNVAAEALQDAWRDGVLDSLPPDATAREKAEAFANAICEAFAGKKDKALDNEWERRKSIIDSLEQRFPDLHGIVSDAYDARKQELAEEMAERIVA